MDSSDELRSSSPSTSAVDLDELARRDEEQYVHEVYETIASHFSSTRYKPWPGITKFFESLPAGALGVDAGCGNGKYLGLRSALLPISIRQDPSIATQTPKRSKHGKERAIVEQPTVQEATITATGNRQQLGPILTIGVDRSSNLVGIAKERSHEVLVGDAIDLPWRNSAFDFAISIATIHHFTTPSRRKEAVRTMLRAIDKRKGKLFIQVWAQEQSLPTTDICQIHKGHDADKPIPLLKKQRDMAALEEASTTLKSLKLDSGPKQDVFVPWKLQKQNQPTGPEASVRHAEPQVFQRYYHLFRSGELRNLVSEAASAELSQEEMSRFKLETEELWEQGNWCIQAHFTLMQDKEELKFESNV